MKGHFQTDAEPNINPGLTALSISNPCLVLFFTFLCLFHYLLHHTFSPLPQKKKKINKKRRQVDSFHVQECLLSTQGKEYTANMELALCWYPCPASLPEWLDLISPDHCLGHCWIWAAVSVVMGKLCSDESGWGLLQPLPRVWVWKEL